MGFKCRLFGHTYGNPEVERSRTEEGDEVVVTIRNVKRCERCGDEKMVNQTKEVTSVRSLGEVGLDPGEEASAAPGPPNETDTPPETPDTGVATGHGDGDSPVTPAATPDPEASVDATVGPDVELGTDASADPAGVGPGDDTAAPQNGNNVDDHPDPVDPSEVADDRDEDAVVEAVEDVEAADAPMTESAEESTATEGTDGWETGSDDWDDIDPDPDVDDAVILDAGETERDEVQWPEESDADPEAATDTANSDAPEPADEDPANNAEIIDAGEPGDDPAEATTSGWPEHEDTDAAREWPDHDSADEGYSAAPNGDIDTEFGGNGLTPETNGGAPDDPAAVDGIAVAGTDSGTVEQRDPAPDSETDSGHGGGFVRAEESATGDVPANQVEFYCPNCGHARVAGVSSIRAGDICPECKRGYIAERER